MTGDCSDGLGSKPRGAIQQEALAAVPCPRKLVPHAIDSPRPPQKGKHVMWEKQRELNKDMRAEEGLVGEDATGRKGVMMKYGRKNVVKGKLRWLFEQDRLYWEVPAKDKAKSSSSPHATPSDAARPTEELVKNANVLNGISPDGAPWSPVDHISDSVNVGEDYQEDGDLQFGCSSTDDDDDDSRNFDLEMSHLEMNAPEIEVFITTPQAQPGMCVMGESSDAVSGFASMDDASSCFEAREVNKEQEEWKRQTAILKTKCKVLKMEKALVQQRWKEGCKQMMQAAEMAHSLHAAVESILKPLRNTVTASQPCSTSCGSMDKDNDSAEGLVERLERPQDCSDDQSQPLDSKVQLHLEQQAKAMLEMDDKLQRKLQNKDPSNFHNTKETCNQQRSHRARNQMKPASISSMSLKKIEKENKVRAPNENLLNSLSGKAQKSKTATDRLLKQAQRAGCILEEAQAKEVQTKETVRKILAQIQVEAEQWTQVQDVLKHVCTEIETLQQACQGWEKCALNAESQAMDCQLERDEWWVKAQNAQQRIKEVEVQMVQLQETVQVQKLCHAQEQNQWLDVGSSMDSSNIVGYTLALEPISNANSSDSCGHKISKEFEGCGNCGKLCQVIVEETHNLDRFGLLCDRHSFGGSLLRIPSPCRQHPSAHWSVPRYPSSCAQHPLTVSVPRAQSPCRSAFQETSQLRKVSCNHHNPQDQQLTTLVADNARTSAQQSSNWKLGMKNEVVRPSSQEGSSQQTQTRWQKGPAQQKHGHIKKSKNQANSKGNTKSLAGMKQKGGAVQGNNPMRKVHQFPAGISRGPCHLASSIDDDHQGALKEVSANIIPCRN